jgi:hypothetical protein
MPPTCAPPEKNAPFALQFAAKKTLDALLGAVVQYKKELPLWYGGLLHLFLSMKQNRQSSKTWRFCFFISTSCFFSAGSRFEWQLAQFPAPTSMFQACQPLNHPLST